MSNTTRFPAGTFTPAPRRASPARMLMAQGKVESQLFLRHGEQQLLNLFIPLVGLINGLMPLFNQERQALHDMIAKTVVLKKN